MRIGIANGGLSEYSACCSPTGGGKKCSPSGLRGPQPRPCGGPQLFANAHTVPPQAATRKHFINKHASAQPAAEAISDEGRPQRRSVKNRRPFDCFKSAAGIRFSAGAVADPEIVSPRRFFGYLLSAQKVTYKTTKEACDSQSRAGRSLRLAEARNGIRIVAFPAGHGPKTFPLRRLQLADGSCASSAVGEPQTRAPKTTALRPCLGSMTKNSKPLPHTIFPPEVKKIRFLVLRCARMGYLCRKKP